MEITAQEFIEMILKKEYFNNSIPPILYTIKEKVIIKDLTFYKVKIENCIFEKEVEFYNCIFIELDFIGINTFKSSLKIEKCTFLGTGLSFNNGSYQDLILSDITLNRRSSMEYNERYASLWINGGNYKDIFIYELKAIKTTRVEQFDNIIERIEISNSSTFIEKLHITYLKKGNIQTDIKDAKINHIHLTGKHFENNTIKITDVSLSSIILEEFENRGRIIFRNIIVNKNKGSFQFDNDVLLGDFTLHNVPLDKFKSISKGATDISNIRLYKAEFSNNDNQIKKQDNMLNSEIFISYAWGGKSERLVDKLDETLQQKGILLIRDKRESGFKDLITEFMKQIGRGKGVVLVISDKYLKSPYCMYELLEIYRNLNFKERIFPIVMSDAKGIYEPLPRLSYSNYWKSKKQELETEIENDAEAITVIGDDYKIYKKIFDNLGEIINIVKDINSLTPKTHISSNFKEIIKAIESNL